MANRFTTYNYITQTKFVFQKWHNNICKVGIPSTNYQYILLKFIHIMAIHTSLQNQFLETIVTFKKFDNKIYTKNPTKNLNI